MPVPELRPSPLGPFIHEALGDLPVPEGVEVEVDCPADLPPALADPGQVRIALGKLIRNACDAMPSGGRLTIRGRRDDCNVEVAVIDTGVGIPTADLGRIIEPLYSTKARGLGLGLAPVRMILEKNGGGLDVASEPGRGSTFAVRLTAAPEGTTALALLGRRPYDVALLDLKMPGMDGVTLCREIQRVRSGTVSLLVTAYAGGDTAREALDAGAWQVLSKPADFPRLIGLIDEAMGWPQVLVDDDDDDLCANLRDL